MKYRKKPIVIEAVQWTGSNDDEIRQLAKGCDRTVAFRHGDSSLMIYTLEGNHIASIGDWIIKGVQGELYPCKPDIFAATYDAVQEEEDKPSQDGDIYFSVAYVKDGAVSRTKKYMSGKMFVQILMKHIAESIPDILPDYWKGVKNEHANM